MKSHFFGLYYIVFTALGTFLFLHGCTTPLLELQTPLMWKLNLFKERFGRRILYVQRNRFHTKVYEASFGQLMYLIKKNLIALKKYELMRGLHKTQDNRAIKNIKLQNHLVYFLFNSWGTNYCPSKHSLILENFGNIAIVALSQIKILMLIHMSVLLKHYVVISVYELTITINCHLNKSPFFVEIAHTFIMVIKCYFSSSD